MTALALALGATGLRASQVALTVADEMAFAALEDDVKRLVQRLAAGGGMHVLLGDADRKEDAMGAAYRQGWEDAIEEIGNSVGSPSDSDIEHGISRLQARGF